MPTSNLYFLAMIFLASLTEYFGDASFKSYARLGSRGYLASGVIFYIILILFLIHLLSFSNVLQMNIQWDALSVILESLLAYLILGEVLSEPSQYIGFTLIVLGLITMNLGKSSYQ